MYHEEASTYIGFSLRRELQWLHLDFPPQRKLQSFAKPSLHLRENAWKAMPEVALIGRSWETFFSLALSSQNRLPRFFSSESQNGPRDYIENGIPLKHSCRRPCIKGIQEFLLWRQPVLLLSTFTMKMAFISSIAMGSYEYIWIIWCISDSEYLSTSEQPPSPRQQLGGLPSTWVETAVGRSSSTLQLSRRGICSAAHSESVTVPAEQFSLIFRAQTLISSFQGSLRVKVEASFVLK